MQRRSARRTLVVATAAAVVVAGACAPPPTPGPPLPPVTLVVTTTDDVVDPDDGELSLREAFTAASSNGADTTVVVSAGATYELVDCARGVLTHTGGRTLLVSADGPVRATVRQTCGTRVMQFSGAPVTLERLVVRGGRLSSHVSCGTYFNPACQEGAGIRSSNHLTLRDVEMTDNRVVNLPDGPSGLTDGGALAVRAGATIEDSHLHGNRSNAGGGAIASYGLLEVRGSLFEANSAGWGNAVSARNGSVVVEGSEFRSNTGGSGGALRLDGATLAATDTVFRSNSSGGGPGAAIWADSAVGSLVLERVAVVGNSGRTGAITLFAGVSDVRIIDSTITDNVATTTWRDIYNRAAGGIATLGRSNITITGSTIAHNTAHPGGGANIDLAESNGTVVTLVDSIMSDPLGSPDNCEPNGNTVVVDGSLVSDGTCGAPASGGPALLGPLATDGTTWFRVPGTGSGAIDALAAPCSTASDQRSVARPAGAGCDLGAVEQ